MCVRGWRRSRLLASSSSDRRREVELGHLFLILELVIESGKLVKPQNGGNDERRQLFTITSSKTVASLPLNPQEPTLVTIMTNEQDSVVPDSLLAFAKDHRYIRQCQVLLQQVFFSQSTEKNTWWWSALLYATLVVGRKGRTLGMEFMGLQHHEPTFQKRAAQVLLAAGWAFWIRQYMKRGGVVEEQQRQHERLRGAARQYFYEQQRRAMMQRASPLQASSTSSSSQPLNATQIPNGTPSSDWTGRIRKSFQRLIQVG